MVDEIVPEVSDVVATENIVETEEDDSLAFPHARVVRILKEEMHCGKQIRSEVKYAVNEWLGDVLKKVAREMDKSPYGSIGMADFQRATKPFDMITHIVKDHERLMIATEKLKVDADQVKRDMSRFFVNLTGEEEKTELQQ